MSVALIVDVTQLTKLPRHFQTESVFMFLDFLPINFRNLLFFQNSALFTWRPVMVPVKNSCKAHGSRRMRIGPFE